MRTTMLPTNDRSRAEDTPPEYPTLESLAGAAGTLPEPKPFEQVLDEVREERLAHKFPPRDE
jgi:hypothetical protein